jgi:DNA ligase-1
MAQLVEGQPQYAQGSGAKPYEMKNTGGVLSCSCPAWRNQGAKIDRRTCKHLRALLGSAAEDARIGGGTARPAPAAAPSALPSTLPAPAPAAGGDSADEVLAAVFGRAAPQSAPQAFGPAEVVPDSERQRILDRAASQGRKLRQDEKAKLNGPGIMLAHPWDGDQDPTGWLWSVKLDGCRGYWSGSEFISRQGNVFAAPAWFKAGLPDHPLDGELWMGRQAFQKTMSIVRRQDAGDLWKQIRYVVFDAPHLTTPFEDRLDFLAEWHRTANPAFTSIHPHDKVRDKDHLRQLLKEAEVAGDEGIMIRKPGSFYETCRSHSLLKVKPFHDAEATVIDHEPGKGRHKGHLGSLVVRMPDGKTFNVGTGLSDEDRRNPPPIGSVVTYSFTETTEAGIPKCAAFLRIRPPE